MVRFLGGVDVVDDKFFFGYVGFGVVVVVDFVRELLVVGFVVFVVFSFEIDIEFSVLFDEGFWADFFYSGFRDFGCIR